MVLNGQKWIENDQKCIYVKWSKKDSKMVWNGSKIVWNGPKIGCKSQKTMSISMSRMMKSKLDPFHLFLWAELSQPIFFKWKEFINNSWLHMYSNEKGRETRWKFISKDVQNGSGLVHKPIKWSKNGLKLIKKWYHLSQMSPKNNYQPLFMFPHSSN